MLLMLIINLNKLYSRSKWTNGTNKPKPIPISQQDKNVLVGIQKLYYTPP